MKADAQLTLFAEAFLNLASLSPLPGTSEARMMTVTSGRRCSELYPKSDPLGSSVRMCLESLSWHSTMCYLTWKTSATPAKRLIYQLAPSMPRTSGKGCGLWRTPEAMDCANREFARNSRGEPKLSAQVKGMWPTIRASDGAHGGSNQRDSAGNPALPAAVKMWPTPQTRDYRSGDEPDSIRAQRKQEQGWSQNLNDSVKMWATPNAADSVGGHGGGQHRSLRTDICEVKHGMWPTPSTPRPHDNEKTVGKYMMSQNQKDLTIAAKNGGQLNPDWVDTMMGFPAGWSEPDCDEPQELPFPAPMGCEQYEWEPPRVTTNCPNRANRLKADGNAVIPQIPEIFGRLIMAVEGGANP